MIEMQHTASACTGWQHACACGVLALHHTPCRLNAAALLDLPQHLVQTGGAAMAQMMQVLLSESSSYCGCRTFADFLHTFDMLSTCGSSASRSSRSSSSGCSSPGPHPPHLPPAAWGPCWDSAGIMLTQHSHHILPNDVPA